MVATGKTPFMKKPIFSSEQLTVDIIMMIISYFLHDLLTSGLRGAIIRYLNPIKKICIEFGCGEMQADYGKEP